MHVVHGSFLHLYSLLLLLRVMETVMMGAVSVILVRYWLLLYPALAFLAYVFYGIFRQYPQVPGGSIYDTLPPTLIATGLCVMYTACKDCEEGWNKQFWLGEALVIGMFSYNSLGYNGAAAKQVRDGGDCDILTAGSSGVSGKVLELCHCGRADCDCCPFGGSGLSHH